ncbi:uncharacterized protein VP01_4035g2 [Puccinia sorghi]|uniref:Retrotransposon Copia-like N-terminal domain-containing protein n=1 Tax=Puccinia sorghi TaxID=27349 RepID=A0A0L6URQ4_9BASI|nr:uncharacterized protein VP01_4035g2 [Puccinia sorghi]
MPSFHCYTIKIPSSIKFLLTNGSNFNKWKRDLNMAICLCLHHMGFLNSPTKYPLRSTEESNVILFFIQKTLHNKLSSIFENKSATMPSIDNS